MVKSKDYPIKWDHANLEKFGHFVQNLFLRDSPPELSLLCLSSCPNVTNLSCWVHISQDMMDTMSHLHLTHLSINLNVIQNPTPGLIKVFSRITHLDCLGRVNVTLGHIIHFTSLTHVSIPWYNLMERPILPILFGRFPKLETVISLRVSDSYESHDQTVSIVEEFNPDLDDPRVVKMSLPFENGVGDWLEDVKYGRGIWGLAGEAVTRRMQESPLGLRG
ncbi:hypothetical protein BDN72DRAFT_883937 [Pluteus cervinus]|uniref:Uncharacterized protein n=1 Tax=Pluteus cervinus TaxID=181527 RepID=A0ACD3A1K4_9AGAR|nr:hypothetical protein BDN72DRAFT_883937 [Pluteus cervinus]